MSLPARSWLTWVTAILPVLSVNVAFLINVAHGLEPCFPYFEGCYSISRALRSGPGLWLFKILALPAAAAMAATWLGVQRWLQRDGLCARPCRLSVSCLGLLGAVSFLVYAAWLGTEGEVYRWLRRYGVVFYFAGTGLAQLILVSALWRERAGRIRRRDTRRFAALVAVAWGLGVASALKRKIVPDPAFLDRVENALEWDFALALSLAFLGLLPLLRERR